MGKVFRMLSLPLIFGELIGGIIVGPMVLGIIDPDNLSIKVLAELGIFFMMLHAGLEADPHELAKGSRKSILIAIGGVLVPFIGGYFVTQALGFTLSESLFVAIAISATAIAISVRILKDYKLQNTKLGHTVLAAAIISDIIILIAFSLIVQLIEIGSISAETVGVMLIKILLFFAIIIIGGLKTQKYFCKIFANKGFTLTLILALCFGLIAEFIGLHIIIGSFLAGLFIREQGVGKKVFDKIEDRIYGLSYSFLGPIFFTSLAFYLDFSAIKERPQLFIILFLTAFFGKLIGSGVAALIQKFKPLKALIIGLTMNSRGAVDLIIISIGFQKGIIGQDLFSVLVFMAFAATFVTIVAIKPLKRQLKCKK